MRKRNRGFTIIELLVVFTTMVLLAGVSFVAFVSYSKKQVVEQSALDFKSIIERAKFNAISRVKPDRQVTGDEGLNNCSELQKYEIRVSQDQEEYNLYVVCGNGEAVLLTKALPADVGFSEGDKGCVVGFNLLSSTSSLDEAKIAYQENCTFEGSENLVKISIAGNGIIKYVNVDKGGNISIN